MNYRPPILLRGKRPPRQFHPLVVLVPFSLLMIGLAFSLGMRDGTPEVHAKSAAAVPSQSLFQAQATAQPQGPTSSPAASIQIEELPAMPPSRQAASSVVTPYRAPDAAVDITPVRDRRFGPLLMRANANVAQRTYILPGSPASPAQLRAASSSSAASESEAIPAYRAPAYRTPAYTAVQHTEPAPSPTPPAIDAPREVNRIEQAVAAPAASLQPSPQRTTDRNRQPDRSRNAKMAASRSRRDRDRDSDIDPSQVRHQFDSFFNENDFRDEHDIR